MPIHKNCEQCHKDYTVPPARAAKTRFCSVACKQDAARTAERMTLACSACGSAFTAAMDHGVWPKFCSRTCFVTAANGDGPQKSEKNCKCCGAVFMATKSKHDSEDGLQDFCSNACANEARRTGDQFQCLNCDAPFYLSPSTLRKRGKPGCCSRECQTAFYTGARSAGFRGGFYTHTQAGEKHLLLPRPGYVGKYVGEHRVVASREIGRLVTHEEYVIRINRRPDDNRPENLFICESNSEFSKRRNGSLPWPTASNLCKYKAGAVVASPNAKLTGRQRVRPESNEDEPE